MSHFSEKSLFAEVRNGCKDKNKVLVPLIIPGTFASLAFSENSARQYRHVLYVYEYASSWSTCAYVQQLHQMLTQTCSMHTNIHILISRASLSNPLPETLPGLHFPICMFTFLLPQWEAWSPRPSTYDSFCTICILFLLRHGPAVWLRLVQPSRFDPQGARLTGLHTSFSWSL